MTTYRMGITLFLVCLLAFPPHLLNGVASAATPLDPASDDYAALASQLRQQARPERLDAEAMVDALDYEQDEIVDFVARSIRFEQYPGLLRGPAGTLMAGAGNALDQALLLAKMLRDAGFDARIVRGALGEAEATRLLDTMTAPHDPPEPLELERLSALLAKTDHDNLRNWVDPRAPTPRTREMLEQVAALLEDALAKAPPRGEPTGALIEEASDYFWVEHRDSAAGAWQAAHPAFAGAQAPGPKAREYYEGSVPDALAHRLRVRVFLERLERDRLIVDQITPDWQRPVANLNGRSLSITSGPVDLPIEQDDPDFATKLGDALGAASLFVPSINGQVLPGSKGFDVNGVPYSVDAVGGDAFGMAPLFQTVGEGFDKAAAALDGLGQKNARERLRYLTGVWIDYALIGPDGEERTFRRYLVDRIGEATRRSGVGPELALEPATPRELIAGDEFIVATGAVPAEYLVSEYANWMEVRAKLAAARASAGKLSMGHYAAALKDTSGSEALRLYSLARRFDARLDGDADATYRSGPTLLALHWAAVDDDRARATTDIITNDRRARAWRDPRAAQARILRRGVWETFVERSAFDDWQSASSVRTAFDMFDRDGIAQLDVVPAAGSERFAMRPDTQAMLARDAGRFLVVAPLAADSDTEGWWRIDPHSGSTIGVLPDGRGAGNLVAYVALIAVVAIFAARAIGAYGRCLDLLYREAQMCIGSVMNAITGNAADPYVNDHLSECFWQEFSLIADSREPACQCGGYAQPPCPDWQTPFAN